MRRIRSIPVLPYGICKAAVEQLGRSYQALHGLEVIYLRADVGLRARTSTHPHPQNLGTPR